MGVDLGGTTIKAGLFDEQLQLLKMVQKNTGASLGADIVLKRIEKCLEILVLKNNLLFEQIDALGIGVPALLNRNDGISLFSPNFNNWHNVKIKEWFEHKWLIPTVIDNDVRMHLYGELYFGAGKGFKNIICKDRVLPKYLYFLLLFNVDYLNLLGRGATFKEISKKIVENIKIPVPPLNLQEQFSAFVTQVDKSKSVIQKSLKETQLLFDSLMQEYFG